MSAPPTLSERTPAQREEVLHRLAPMMVFHGAGWGQTCGVTDSNEVYCWGHNHHGQLGDGSLADKRTPIRIAGEL